MSEMLEIRVSRVNKTFRPGERVTGVVLIRGGGSVSHSGLVLRAMGSVCPQLESRAAANIFDAAKPVVLSDVSIEMAPAGKLPSDVAIPFEFTLAALPGRTLTESYHGVYVNVKYVISAMLMRTGFMAKPLEGQTEFIVEVPVRKDVYRLFIHSFIACAALIVSFAPLLFKPLHLPTTHRAQSLRAYQSTLSSNQNHSKM